MCFAVIWFGTIRTPCPDGSIFLVCRLIRLFEIPKRLGLPCGREDCSFLPRIIREKIFKLLLSKNGECRSVPEYMIGRMDEKEGGFYYLMVWLRLLYEMTLIETVSNNLSNFVPRTLSERVLKIMLRSRIGRSFVHRLKMRLCKRITEPFMASQNFKP